MAVSPVNRLPASTGQTRARSLMAEEPFSQLSGGEEKSSPLYFVICRSKQEYHERIISKLEKPFFTEEIAGGRLTVDNEENNLCS
jgi:hypothetical protein